MKISNSEDVVQISGEYTCCYASIGALHELRKQGDSYTVSMDIDMLLDNKTIAVEQEEK
jgi:hypothetical protein